VQSTAMLMELLNYGMLAHSMFEILVTYFELHFTQA